MMVILLFCMVSVYEQQYEVERLEIYTGLYVRV